MRILYYFDVISPYSALSWAVLRRYRPRWNFELQLRPFFLGGVMMASGNKPPAMVPNKGRFLPQDLARSGAQFGVELLPSPANFFSEVARKVIQCQRVLCAAQLLHPADTRLHEGLVSAFTDAIHLDAGFRDADNNLAIDAAFLAAVCERANVPSVDALLAAAAGPEAKAALRANTDEAVERGAFGSPTMLVDLSAGSGEVNPAGDAGNGDPFFVFGSDRFEQIAFAAGRSWDGPNPAGAEAGRSKL